MYRKNGPLDQIVFDQWDALVAIREAKVGVRRVFRDLTAAENRVLEAQRKTDPIAISNRERATV